MKPVFHSTYSHYTIVKKTRNLFTGPSFLALLILLSCYRLLCLLFCFFEFLNLGFERFDLGLVVFLHLLDTEIEALTFLLQLLLSVILFPACLGNFTLHVHAKLYLGCDTDDGIEEFVDFARLEVNFAFDDHDEFLL